MSTLAPLFFTKKQILAMGAESEGVFSFYKKGEIFISDNFGDLTEEKNYSNFKREISKLLIGFRPDIILTDLHPLYNSSLYGRWLGKKLALPVIKVQHHLAHIFSAYGEGLVRDSKSKICNERNKFIQGNTKFSSSIWNLTKGYLEIKLKDVGVKSKDRGSFFGIACDGTGYGLDGKIWGGEIFKCQTNEIKSCSEENEELRDCLKNEMNSCCINFIERIGHLENQIMIGGDLAIKEPARMLISILNKVGNQKPKIESTTQNSKLAQGPISRCGIRRSIALKPLAVIWDKFSQGTLQSMDQNLKFKKEFIYQFVKRFYPREQFEVLYNQLKENFNCYETSSTGRVLDAVSVLLGFAKNQRSYKHEPINLLEKNSTRPYNLESKISYDKDEKRYILLTTPLFEYLIKNLNRDKKRLAATAQMYIARGLHKIISDFQLSIFNQTQNSEFKTQNSYFAGGIANNKIISNFLEKQGVITNKIIPRGDSGISFGQLIYFLLISSLKKLDL